MSIEAFFNKISGYLTNVLNSDKIDRESRVSNPFKGAVNVSIFSGKSLDEFKSEIVNGIHNGGKNSIFFQNINEIGAEAVFDYLDKNGDGTIDQTEIQQISGADDNKDDISGYDLHLLLNDVADKKLMDNFDAMIQAGLINAQRINDQSIQSYIQNIGGQHYRNYGSQTHNGSTISTTKQYSTKQKLDNIENKDIQNFKEGWFEFFNTKLPELAQKLNEGANLEDADMESLRKTLDEYKSGL